MGDAPERLRAEAREDRDRAGQTSLAPDRALLTGMAGRRERQAGRAEAARPRSLAAEVGHGVPAGGSPDGAWPRMAA